MKRDWRLWIASQYLHTTYRQGMTVREIVTECNKEGVTRRGSGMVNGCEAFAKGTESDGACCFSLGRAMTLADLPPEPRVDCPCQRGI
jgi:hypothetical protein